MANSIDILAIPSPDLFAREIAVRYDKWKRSRRVWEATVKDVRDYVYATETTTTQNNTNTYSNKTSIPKLTEIKDNLLANLMSVLFGREDWLSWESHEDQKDLQKKITAIQSYVRTKIRQQEAVNVFYDLLVDFIVYGNCFADLQYVNESKTDPQTGEEIPGYIGPKIFRISPHDIVFNVDATDWKSTPKIIRYLKTIGELRRDVDEKPNLGYTAELLDELEKNRHLATVGGNPSGRGAINSSDRDKSESYARDGFASIAEYYESDMVEILELRGDIYNVETKKLLKNHRVVILDRWRTVYSKPLDSWSNTSYLYHGTWRKRPGNLMGQGPLDNLLGMQHKLNKLENAAMDVYDHYAHPTEVIIGEAEFTGVRGAPGARWRVPEGGNVFHLRPDLTAFTADTKRQQLMQEMEELAGSPKLALGVRSPGEKTAFEVDVLDRGQNKRFIQTGLRFENTVLVPMLNDFLEMGRRNMNASEIVLAQDKDFGFRDFISITKADITGKGKMYPKGVSHFVRDATDIQNINAMVNSAAINIIGPHIDGFALAQVMEEKTNLNKFTFVKKNIGTLQQIETQKLLLQGQNQAEEEVGTDITDITLPEDALDG